jgi:glycosyltransferase involved in cell wall biosynthesis
MHVYVHLAYGFSDETWGRRYDDGNLIGVNERDAYGYRHAEAMGVAIDRSKDHPEHRLAKLHRLGWRWLFGFDLVHAFRNRQQALAADVVWTHTESQHLALCAVLLLFGRRRHTPKLLAQSVWLIDHWKEQPIWRRWLWRRLLRRADLLTFLSPENLAIARDMFPTHRCELVLFGIKPDILQSRAMDRPMGSPLKVLAVGNDKDRDWRTLVDAVRNRPDWHLRIVSQTCPKLLAEGLANVEIAGVRHNDELVALYHTADVGVVPLKRNSHAAGCTVMMEAALFGLPLVTTNVGGLTEYFDNDEVCYVPPGHAGALREAIARCASGSALAHAMATKAQARMGVDGLSSQSFVRRHVELSQELLKCCGATRKNQ